MKSHGPSFLEAFHPEKREKKPTIAVCWIMAITHLTVHPQFSGGDLSRTLLNESGKGVRDRGNWAF